uniref:Uncharacterized protein n=1 Tax=Neobodo designis TaxID=312471 RepID=A0A7S1LQN4_NEODS|mmetsp:Transcript_26544/g.82021  ORF Transcript_26544/g.82021 Transcript_26544/m.82021 type:complete len:1088 (+) Transcript_26544:207-3470(+)|eukprot:CAMPEP_0174832844 /NCGR_PEP_ID=MMETSP1114-20130205/3890_1 /TAXON_ID=312471 /ORGANISM="Neobodo designis, Strain CCAP 1951/1" /LENGTH=1087 /DNA_ID=CAMNT_0016066711 /DNA_START=203 /DNA_END=3466 /DNA_ORIENTATION=-
MAPRFLLISLTVCALFAFFAVADDPMAMTTVAPGTASAQSQHRKRGLMCRKGGKLTITPHNTLYLRGQKKFKDFTEVPLKGTLKAWDGGGFNIPIRTPADANAYVANASLFARGPTSQLKLDARATGGRRYFVPRFEYRAPVERNATGFVTAYPTARPMDFLKFTAEIFDGRTTSEVVVEVEIDVVNTRPRAVPGRFGIVAGQPRFVSLPAHDIDQRNTPEFQEITNAWITASPSDACKLTDVAGGTPFDFAAKPTYNVSADTLAVYVIPPTTTPEFRCEFNFTVADREGLVSETAPVTITNKAAVKPHAYGSRVRLERGRRTVTFDLFGSSPNIDASDNLAFVISHLPSHGKVFKLDNIQDEPKPEEEIKMPTGPDAKIVISNTTSRRVRLVYQSDEQWLAANNKGPKSGAMLPLPGPDGAPMREEVRLTFYVQDKYETSPEANIEISGARNGAPPVCNVTNLFNVFQSSSAVVQLDFGYAAPGGKMITLPRIQRVMLLSEPKGADAQYGHLVQSIQFENGTTTRTIHPGDHFSDEDRSLRWVPNPNVTLTAVDRKRLERPLTYRYRAMTPEGLFCDGALNVFLQPQGDPNGADNGHTWVERATTGRLHLFVLRAPDVPKNASIAAARINSMANFQGTLWRVNENVPVSQIPVFVGSGKRMLSACRVLNCSNFKSDQQIKERDEIQATTDARSGFSQVLFLYEPPARPPTQSGMNPTGFSFSYKLSNDGEFTPETPPHYFKMFIVQGELPQIEFQYDAPVVNFNMSEGTDLQVPLVFGDRDHNLPAAKYAVRVRSFNGGWRHNSRPAFKLLQVASVDGDRYIGGEPVGYTTRDGVKGKFIKFNNTLLLVPTARARTKVFRFRVTVYPLDDAGNIPNEGALRTTYRVIVRQRNHVPRWEIGGVEGTPTDVRTAVGTPVTIPLSLTDDDDDALSFRLLKGPKYGVLRYPRITLGVSTFKTLREGMIFRIRKGSALRQQAFVVYTSGPGATSDAYPLKDEIVIVADDGSGVMSAPLTVHVHVEASEQAMANRAAAHATPSATTAIVGIVLFLLAIVGGTVAVVRRHRFRVYQALAGADPSNAPHPGVNS